jgi:hypothetical protein
MSHIVAASLDTIPCIGTLPVLSKPHYWTVVTGQRNVDIEVRKKVEKFNRENVKRMMICSFVAHLLAGVVTSGFSTPERHASSTGLPGYGWVRSVVHGCSCPPQGDARLDWTDSASFRACHL